MKKILTFAMVSLLTLTASAQVHGVDGFYYWTAKQMQADGNVTVDNNGKKWNAWKNTLSFDGDYLKVIMGVHDTKFYDNGIGYYWRSGFSINEPSTGAGIMTLPKKDDSGNTYHVLAFKFSMPKNHETAKGAPAGAINIEPYMGWYAPGATSASDMPYPGASKGKYQPVRITVGGASDGVTDTVIYRSRGYKKSATETANCIHVFTVDGDANTDIICIYDLTAHDYNGTNTIDLALDTCDVKISNFSIGMNGIYADTLKVVDGVAQAGVAKTTDERPYYDFKWLRTFKSMEEADAFCSENNGDGPNFCPERDVLNAAIYQAQQFEAGYTYADESALSGLATAIQAAQTVYDNTTATASDYQAQIDALAAANKAFLTAISMKFDSYYNLVADATEQNALAVGTTSAQYGSYTGYPITADEISAGKGFQFVEAGTINGLQAYTLKTSEGTVVQANDANHTLIFTADATAIKNATAYFVFTNRMGEDRLCDMKVGSYYYYVDAEGALKCVASIPATTDQDEYISYLWNVSAADYTPSGDTADLFAGWEFNDDATDDGSGLAADESIQLDGWRMNRWNMTTRITKGAADNGEQCMVVKSLPTYYAYDDISHTTAFSTVYPVGAALVREGGVYTNVYDRGPAGNVRDSYLAIKAASPDHQAYLQQFLLWSPSFNYPLTIDNIAGKKGDVCYWNLQQLGIPYGKIGYAAQFLSINNLQSENSKLFIDWVRTYASVDEIPTESLELASGIQGISENTEDMKIIAGNGVVVVEGSGDAQICDLAGKVVAQSAQTGINRYQLQKGIYIVKLQKGNMKKTEKVVVE